jgi:hypothetical protein
VLFGCVLLNVVPHMAVRLLYFFLDKKVTKNQVRKKASFALGLCPAISQNHGRQSFALLRSLEALASAKFAMPLPALVACIVLADFG